MELLHCIHRIVTHALQVIESVQFGAQSTVDAEELLVHDSRKGEGAERVHAGLVDDL